MAYTDDSKPLELTELTSLATDDTFIVGDTSDTSEVVKYITKANLLSDFGATFAALSHTHTASEVTDFDTEVANNAAVTANTAKLTANTANVTAAGALMDSELTSITDVKAINQSLVSGAAPVFDATNFTNLPSGTVDVVSNVATNRILGRTTAGSGDSEELTTAQARTLLNVEDGADVTDTTNVTAAGALMDSEVTSLSGIKTLTVPDSTTISTFGATLVDDANAAAARTTLGVDAAGTDNSTDVTLAGTGTYISIAGQVITVDPITESDISDLGTYLTDVVSDTTPQLGGDLDCNGKNITDVHEIRLDGVPDTDETANGPTTSSFNAGETVAKFELVTLKSDGEWHQADANETGTVDRAMLAIALEAGTDTNPLKVALPGSFIRDDTWAWTVGGAIFASTTAGALTQTAPSATDDEVRCVGYAMSADVMYFMPTVAIVHA